MFNLPLITIIIISILHDTSCGNGKYSFDQDLQSRTCSIPYFDCIANEMGMMDSYIDIESDVHSNQLYMISSYTLSQQNKLQSILDQKIQGVLYSMNKLYIGQCYPNFIYSKN